MYCKFLQDPFGAEAAAERLAAGADTVLTNQYQKRAHLMK